MTVDPFSEILKLIDAQTFLSGGFSAGGAWAVRLPATEKINFFSLVKGRCWLHIEGDDEAVQVESGDVFLLSDQRPFVLASDMQMVPIEADDLFADKVIKFATLGQLGQGEDCVEIGCQVRLDASNGAFLARALPPLIRVQAGSAHSANLKWLIERLVHEQAEHLPGSDMASIQLAQLIFVELLRAHLTESGAMPPGWLRALSDARIATALRLIHGQPGHDWTLGELAKACAMSRTNFALRFKSLAGMAPLTYLNQWRMGLAERSLREGKVPIAVLGRSLGYASESAFSNAFKRVTGHSPTRYRSVHSGRQ